MIRRLFLLIIALLFMATPFASIKASALPDAQKKLFNEQVNYFNIDACSLAANSSTPASSGGVTPGPVYILGDSITAISADTYTKKFSKSDGWDPTVAGLATRQIKEDRTAVIDGKKTDVPSGISQIEKDKDAIGKAHAIVVGLGSTTFDRDRATNAEAVKLAMDKINKYRTQGTPVFWINVYYYGHEAESRTTNQAIKDGVGGDATVIDWYSEAKAKLDVSQLGDGLHPYKQQEQNVLVDLVYGAVTGSGGDNTAVNNKVYVIGDSLTEGMRDSGNLKAKLSNSGWAVTAIEATTGISIDASISKIRDDKAKTVSQAGTIIVGLGTNPAGGGSKQAVEDMISAINTTSPDAQIVWVNAYATNNDYSGFNDILTGHTGTGQGKITKVLDWAKEAKANVSDYNLAGGGGIHTTAAGYVKRSAWLVGDLGKPANGNGAPASTSSIGCCPAQSSTQLSGKDNAEKVWNFFADPKKGLTNIQIAGIMGNLQIESGFDPTIVYGGSHVSDPSTVTVAWGLGQWLPGSKVLIAQKKAGVSGNIADLATQLDIMWWEATHVSPTGYTNFINDYKKINDASEVENSAFWQKNYEGSYGQLNDERVAAAIVWKNNASHGAGSNAAATTDVSNSEGTCSSDSSNGGFGGYKNPFHDMKNLLTSRIDEGVDYLAKPGTTVPVYAIGNGEIKIATDRSTFFTTSGGHADWITYQLSDGPAKGEYVYVSEACTIDPDILSGKTKQVTTDTHLCDMLPDSIETGWALDASSQAAAALSSYIGHHGYKTAYGVNFNELLVKLGAPGGHLGSGVPDQVVGSLPSDWPKW